MSEKLRLQELREFEILDTTPEKEFDEYVQIASTICDTPVSLITFIDKDRVWFKSKIGFKASQAKREISFCRFLLDEPGNMFIVEDASIDTRFKENPLVFENPKIRFYAAAPLLSQNGFLLGALCVVDMKPRTISESQKKALQVLAKRVVNLLDRRRTLLELKKNIASNSSRLKKLTNQVSSFFMQFEMDEFGNFSIPFQSDTISVRYPEIAECLTKGNYYEFLEYIHPEDQDKFFDCIHTSLNLSEPWEKEFRIISREGNFQWYLGKVISEKRIGGGMSWFATFQNISAKKDYSRALEDILFYISHELRKPVENLLSIAAVVKKEQNLDEESLKLYAGYIETAGIELDGYIRMMNRDYLERRSNSFN